MTLWKRLLIRLSGPSAVDLSGWCSISIDTHQHYWHRRGRKAPATSYDVCGTTVCLFQCFLPMLAATVNGNRAVERLNGELGWFGELWLRGGLRCLWTQRFGPQRWPSEGQLCLVERLLLPPTEPSDRSGWGGKQTFQNTAVTFLNHTVAVLFWAKHIL